MRLLNGFVGFSTNASNMAKTHVSRFSLALDVLQKTVRFNHTIDISKKSGGFTTK